jgi:hypothetical protein
MTIVMLAHPECPCTKASVEELARIMARADVREKAQAFVAFRAWDDIDPKKTALWARVATIPQTTPVVDDGHEAALFHATTSGHVVVFDPAGRLQFSGGITGARGHQGDNAGEARVIALLTTGSTPRAESPIFGCALEDE